MDDELRRLFLATVPHEPSAERAGGKDDAQGQGRAEPPGVSLVITNRQRMALRDLGYSDATIQEMTPLEAHRALGLSRE